MEAQPLTYIRRTPQEVVDAVMEFGNINALQGYIELKRMEVAVSDAIAKLRDKATEEAAAYGKGEHKAFGAVIQCRSSAGKWDFSGLPWYSNIQSMQENLDMTRKAKEEMAKAAQKAQEKMQPLPVDMETGEQIQPAVYTPGRETVAISLPKE